MDDTLDIQAEHRNALRQLDELKEDNEKLAAKVIEKQTEIDELRDALSEIQNDAARALRR